MGLTGKQMKDLEMAALLHDIGKIGIPDFILTKSGELNEAEFLMMKHHPKLGAKIIEKIKGLEEVTRGVLEHHERCDGTGYPDGKKEQDISLIGRIIAVADCFDAMLARRPYKDAMNITEAIETIIEEAEDGKLDLKVAEAFYEGYGSLFKAVRKLRAFK